MGSFCKLRATQIALFLTQLISVYGHGRLMEPAARNCMWRFGYPNPVNYNDNELYCGGFVVQYQTNSGRCGVCGDDWREEVPRSHEAGGIYANGITARRYVMGQEIEIEAELTTNHKGFMEVKLCPNNDPNTIITQECLDKYPLPLADRSGYRFIIPKDSQKYEIYRWKVRLPEGVTCAQCVIQWKYFAGNTWGTCTDGTESTGCGNQETFINCADVIIHTNTGSLPVNVIDNPWAMFTREAYPGHGVSIKTNPDKFTQLVVRYQLCIPVGDYSTVDGMADWCRVNCMKYPPNCHPDACKCVNECKAVGEFALQDEADVWCHQNCLRYPPKCPKERCECF